MLLEAAVFELTQVQRPPEGWLALFVVASQASQLDS